MRAHRRSGATILCTCQPPRQFPARARGTNDYRPSCTARRRPIFIPLCGLRKAIGVRRRPESRGVGGRPLPLLLGEDSGEGRNPEGWEGGHFLSSWERIEVRANLTAPEILPTQGSPTPRDVHPLMRPSQGHGDSGESMPRTPIRGRNPRGGVRAWTIDIHNKTPQSVLFYSKNTRSCPSRPTTRSYHCGRDAGKEQLDRPRSRHHGTAGPGRRPQRPPSVEPGKTRRLRDAGPARRGGGLETPPDPHSLRAATANRRLHRDAQWPIGSR